MFARSERHGAAARCFCEQAVARAEHGSFQTWRKPAKLLSLRPRDVTGTSSTMTEKQSRYPQAGSPLRCFLPSCPKPFLGACTRGNDGHFYCSGECTDQGQKMNLSRVEQMPQRKNA